MVRLAPWSVALLILVGCAPREDVRACSVVSAKVSETALAKLTGDARIDQLSANAARCLERGADDLAYLPETADTIARTIIFECQNEITMSKPSMGELIVWQTQNPGQMFPPAPLGSEKEDADYLAQSREHAVAAVIEARHHNCRKAHDIG